MPLLKDMKITLPPPKILAYGEPGVGKTALAATYGPGMQVIAIDNQLSTCFTLEDEFKSARMAIDMVDCVEMRPTVEAMTFYKVKSHMIDLSNQWSKEKKLVTKEGNPITALCIDGLTFLVDACARYILYNTGKLGNVMARGTIQDAIKNNLSIPEWGLIINEIETVIQLARGLPIPVVLTAHAEAQVTNTGMTKWGIAVPTKVLPPKLPGYFDEVWYMTTEFVAGGVRRVIKTRSTPAYVARSNSNLPETVEVKDGMRKIMERMKFSTAA